MRDQTHQPLRDRYCALWVACVTGVLSLCALLPTQATAQGIFGEILDEEAGGPVVSAQVALADSAGNVVGQALSDNAGQFFIAVDIGTYALVVSRLGYETVYVTDVKLTNTDVLPLRIRLSPDAVELPGLVVQGDRGVRYLEVNGFYKRKRLGFGHQLKIERDRQLQTLEPSDFIRRMPDVVVRGGRVRKTRGTALGSPCLLQVLVDGIYRGVDLDGVLVLWNIEAVEVYTRASNVPAQWQSLAFQGYRDERMNFQLKPTCGIVVVWTKH